MTTQKLAVLKVELYQDIDDMVTEQVTQYFTKVYWEDTSATITSPNFSRPSQALDWAGEMLF